MRIEESPLTNSLTIFFLFFGAAVLEAFRSQDWLHVLMWLLIGALFVLLSRRGR